MQTNSLVHDNVRFGSDCSVGDFCAIGVPPRDHVEGQLATVFGHRATFRSHAVVYAGNVAGDDVVIGHGAYIRENNRIGDRVEIGALNVWEGRVEVADDVQTGPLTGIAELTRVGRGVVIGAQVGIAGVLHPLSTLAKETAKGPTIGDGVTIGSGASIGPCLRIGEGAYVEAGAVVVRDVLPFAVVAGNPAKQIGDVTELHPEVISRISRFVDVSPEGIELRRRDFAAEPTHFPPR